MKWHDEIDYLRTIAILAVIGQHVFGDFMKMEAVNGLSVTLMYTFTFLRFAVPMFIGISGFVLTKRYYGDMQLRDFYGKRFATILIPYLAFSLLYLALFTVSGEYQFSVGDYVYRIFTGKASTHLWFIRAILELYLLFPLMLKAFQWAEKSGRVMLLVMLSLLFQITCRILLHVGGDTFPIFAAQPFRLIFTFSEFYFYFVLGMSVARLERMPALALLILEGRFWYVICAMFFVINAQVVVIGMKILGNYTAIPSPWFIVSFITEPFIFCFVAYWLYKLVGKIRNIRLISSTVPQLCPYIFAVYLIHIIFIALNVRFLDMLGINYQNMIYYPFVYASSLGLSFLSIYMLDKVTFFQPALGVPVNKRKRG